MRHGSDVRPGRREVVAPDLGVWRVLLEHEAGVPGVQIVRVQETEAWLDHGDDRWRTGILPLQATLGVDGERVDDGWIVGVEHHFEDTPIGVEVREVAGAGPDQATTRSFLDPGGTGVGEVDDTRVVR